MTKKNVGITSNLYMTSSQSMLANCEHHDDATSKVLQLEHFLFGMDYDHDIAQLIVKASRHEQDTLIAMDLWWKRTQFPQSIDQHTKGEYLILYIRRKNIQ